MKTLYLDIECTKVPAPDDWCNRTRFKPFVVGIGQWVTNRWVSNSPLIEVLSCNDDESLLQAVSERLDGNRVIYSATREFDRMVLEGRWVNARRAHAPKPGRFPHITAKVDWVCLKPLPKSKALTLVDRSQDIYWQKSVEILRYPEVAIGPIIQHCHLDVHDLMRYHRQLEIQHAPNK